MFEKIKKFYNENKEIIFYASATIGIAVIAVAGVKSIKSIPKTAAVLRPLAPDQNVIRQLNALGIDTVIKEGYSVPFITKEGAEEALKMFKTAAYQIDQFDDETWAIWISNMH